MPISWRISQNFQKQKIFQKFKIMQSLVRNMLQMSINALLTLELHLGTFLIFSLVQWLYKSLCLVSIYHFLNPDIRFLVYFKWRIFFQMSPNCSTVQAANKRTKWFCHCNPHPTFCYFPFIQSINQSANQSSQVKSTEIDIFLSPVTSQRKTERKNERKKERKKERKREREKWRNQKKKW